MISDKVRVRFAPSPTGYLHVGGLRTALYNYLFAKKNNGVFVLRIEDTDQNRKVEGAVENLIKTLNWAGLHYDEGPVAGGAHGPYVQSERLDIYKEHANRLVKEGKAYYCFCSKERLDLLRKEQEEKKLQPVYDKHCLKLSKQEIQEKINDGFPYVIRLNIRPNENVVVKDIIRGVVEFSTSTVDDQVLLKSDGFPTYHLANVIDDHYMQITHVIRGEEWLPSTPKHVLLYNYFGWEVPAFAHLPLLLNPDRSKLSKRQGDVAVESYAEKGYLKEALVNFVALLGWNAGDDREFYYLNELVHAFSLERVNKAGAVFDIKKLDWLNAEHLRKLDDTTLAGMLKEELAAGEFKDLIPGDETLLKIVSCMRERISFIKEIPVNAPYLFRKPDSYEEKGFQKGWKAETPAHLNEILPKYEALENPSKDDYERVLRETAESLGIGAGKLIHPLRLAVSGVSGGPGLFDIFDVIGQKEVVERIKTAVEKIRI